MIPGIPTLARLAKLFPVGFVNPITVPSEGSADIHATNGLTLGIDSGAGIEFGEEGMRVYAPQPTVGLFFGPAGGSFYLPGSDPHVKNQVWNDNGTLKL